MLGIIGLIMALLGLFGIVHVIALTQSAAIVLLIIGIVLIAVDPRIRPRL